MRQRVLWVIKGLGPGGAEHLLREHARTHDPVEFHIECAYVLPWKNHLADDLDTAGVMTTCLSGRRRDLLWPVRLARLVRSGNWDAVHVHSPVPGSVARLAARTIPRSSRPTIVSTEHNVWSSHHRLTRVLNRWTLRWTDATFTVTDEVRASMSPSTQRTARTLRHGIDIAAVRRSRASRQRVRAELGFGDDHFVVGTVANHRPQKDYPNLLAAARRVVDERPHVRFVAVGQGPDTAAIAARRSELELNDHVLLTGYRADAVDVLAACDAFVLASRWEGLPVAAMEACAIGLPIVATDVGGIGEHFTTGRDALLVPRADPAALASALVTIADDDELRDRLGGAASATSEVFDVSRAVAAVEAVYRGHTTDRSTEPTAAPTTSETIRPGRVVRGVDIRPATSDDRPAILQLCRDALGWGDDDRFDRLFAWKHDHNRFGPSAIWVATDGDRIVGLRAFMRWEFEYDGQSMRAVRAVDTAVHPEYQGRGLFSALTLHGLDELRRDGIDFVFNTPNEQSRPGYLKMGWQDVGRIPVVMSVAGVSGGLAAIRSRTSASHWPEPFHAGVTIAELLQGGIAETMPSPTSGAPRLTTRLDDAFVSWRFDSALLGYRAIPAGGGHVVVRLRRRGRSVEVVQSLRLGADPREADAAVARLCATTGSSHAIRLGPSDARRGWFAAPALGPHLAWRDLAGHARPRLTTWNLTMADIELF